MPNFTTSPGVAISEIDNTFLTGQPIQAGAAIVGPTVKGPINTPMLVTSYSEYQTMFGDIITSGSNTYSYFTSIAAYNYFNYGGTSLLVTRVASGSYTSATSSYIADLSESIYVVNGYVDPAYVSSTPSQSAFILETIAEGVIMNNGSVGTNGILSSGSKDNVRFEITLPNTQSGTFNLLIRRGNDVNNNKVILESWNNLSLDPFSPRYISKIIGDQKLVYDSLNEQLVLQGDYPNNSRYVRVSAVNSPTPNYLDANGVPKPQYVSQIPTSQSGTFNGATGNVNNTINFYETITSTNTQGVSPSDYDIALNLLANAETYQFNVLFTPGLTNDLHFGTVTDIIANTQDRGDNLFVLDLTGYNSTLGNVVNQATSRDTSYAATYWPWVRIIDPSTGKHVWVPASTVVPGVYAFNDKVAAPWFCSCGNQQRRFSYCITSRTKINSR